jgi:lipopolysaccharide export system protein LptA
VLNSLKQQSHKTFRNVATALQMAIAASGLLIVTTAYGLPGDTKQPIHITADEAVRDERTGLTIYRGNVHMKQGSLRIDADRITIYQLENDAERIVAEGRPAHMQQTQEIDALPMHAEGAIIEYFKQEERVQLRGDARLEQDGTTVRGDFIDYFIREEVVKAAADNSDDSRRVEVVIPPRRLEED